MNPKHGTLNDETVDVALDANYRWVEVLKRSGATDLWIQVDPSGPYELEAEADGLEVIPAGVGSVLIESPSNQAPTVVRLMSTGQVAYSVKGIHRKS